MNFIFAPTPTIIFGNGTISRLPDLAKQLGTHVLLVTGASSGPKETFIDSLNREGIQFTLYEIHGEPTISVIDQGLAMASQNHCDLVIGFGGGSAIDTGKSVAALSTNPGKLLDYLEVIGSGKLLIHPPLPHIAIPTTAGTGAEVTSNAVIGSPEDRVKVSLRGTQLIPKIAIVDPELTYNLPPEITARTGLDALTQLIEPFVSPYSNPITDGFCREGMRRISRSIKSAYEDGGNTQAREDLSLASLLSGLSLANARLGAVHGFAGVIGGMFSAPHGSICAALLPNVVQANVNALQYLPEGDFFLRRYEEIARLLTGNSQSEIEDGIQWLNDLVKDFEIPVLSNYGITTNDFPTIIEKAAISSSMKGNPVKLSEDEMNAILNHSY